MEDSLSCSKWSLNENFTKFDSHYPFCSFMLIYFWLGFSFLQIYTKFSDNLDAYNVCICLFVYRSVYEKVLFCIRMYITLKKLFTYFCIFIIYSIGTAELCRDITQKDWLHVSSSISLITKYKSNASSGITF